VLFTKPGDAIVSLGFFYLILLLDFLIRRYTKYWDLTQLFFLVKVLLNNLFESAIKLKVELLQ